jgi:hypothetical protein
MKPALRPIATVTRMVDGKTITGPKAWFTLGTPYVRQPMTGHRQMIDPVPFTRPKIS